MRRVRLGTALALILACMGWAQEARVVRNVPYATREGFPPRLTQLDIYVPAGKGPFPVVVFIHGGSWSFGDKRFVDTKPRVFNEAGYVFVSINYRLSPAVLHPAHALDCGAAVCWVHQHIAEYNGDPNRVFLLGHSAGAHLAALISTDETYVESAGCALKAIRGTIVLDGAGYDIPKMVTSGELFAESRYEKAFGEDERTWTQASPVTHIARGKDIPPFLIVHAGKRVASRWQAQRLAAALKEAGVDAVVFNEPSKNHITINSSIGDDGDKTTKTILEFLEKHGGSR